jgi:4-amino-4-deoxy-L-arabinose transferase-like glycosyltransferase
VAASFALTGEQSELTARLPSAIFALIFVMFLIWMPVPWLGLEARLIGAIIFLTNIAIIEKGRHIEIDMVYTTLAGISMLLWLSIWSSNGSSRLLWLAPSIALAFGMLVKGPFILLFYYCVVAAVLYYSGKMKSLFSIWHIIGFGIALVPFCVWLLLAFQQTSVSKMSSQMTNQLLIRIIDKVDILYWGRNFVREFTDFLPWLVFLPVLWSKKLTERIAPQYRSLFRGSRLGIVIGFTIISLMPKMESRYTMPVIPLVCILLGWVLSLEKEIIWTDRLWKSILLAGFAVFCVTAAAGLVFVPVSAGEIIAMAAAVCAASFVFLKRDKIQDKPSLLLVTMLLITIAMLQYSTFILDISVPMEIRSLARRDINRIMPAGETINMYNPGGFIFPMVFGLRPPVGYLHDANDINEQVHYIFIRQRYLNAQSIQDKIKSRSPRVLYEVADTEPNEYQLLQME